MKIQLSPAELSRISRPVRHEVAALLLRVARTRCKSSSMEIFFKYRKLIWSGSCRIPSSTVKAAFRNGPSRRLVGLGDAGSVTSSFMKLRTSVTSHLGCMVGRLSRSLGTES